MFVNKSKEKSLQILFSKSLVKTVNVFRADIR